MSEEENKVEETVASEEVADTATPAEETASTPEGIPASQDVVDGATAPSNE